MTLSTVYRTIAPIAIDTSLPEEVRRPLRLALETIDRTLSNRLARSSQRDTVELNDFDEPEFTITEPGVGEVDLGFMETMPGLGEFGVTSDFDDEPTLPHFIGGGLS